MLDAFSSLYIILEDHICCEMSNYSHTCDRGDSFGEQKWSLEWSGKSGHLQCRFNCQVKSELQTSSAQTTDRLPVKRLTYDGKLFPLGLLIHLTSSHTVFHWINVPAWINTTPTFDFCLAISQKLPNPSHSNFQHLVLRYRKVHTASFIGIQRE